MTASRNRDQRVLAIDPTSRGFGFVVLERSEHLIDWAVVETRGDKRAQSLRRLTRLIGRYRPAVVIIENFEDKHSRRCLRIQKLLAAIQVLAAKNSIVTRTISRSQVRQVFSLGQAANKHEIAKAIAARFPELAPRLPPVRKPWMPEDSRSAIFDAAALALAFFHSMEKRRSRRPQISPEYQDGTTT